MFFLSTGYIRRCSTKETLPAAPRLNCNSNSAKLHVAIVDEFLQLDFISLMFHLCQDHWTMPSDESDEPFWTSLNQQYPSTMFSSNIMHLLHLCRRHPIWSHMSVHDVGKGVPIVRSTASLQSVWCICKTQNMSQPNQPLLSLKIWPSHQLWGKNIGLGNGHWNHWFHFSVLKCLIRWPWEASYWQKGVLRMEVLVQPKVTKIMILRKLAPKRSCSLQTTEKWKAITINHVAKKRLRNSWESTCCAPWSSAPVELSLTASLLGLAVHDDDWKCHRVLRCTACTLNVDPTIRNNTPLIFEHARTTTSKKSHHSSPWRLLMILACLNDASKLNCFAITKHALKTSHFGVHLRCHSDRIRQIHSLGILVTVSGLVWITIQILQVGFNMNIHPMSAWSCDNSSGASIPL